MLKWKTIQQPCTRHTHDWCAVERRYEWISREFPFNKSLSDDGAVHGPWLSSQPRTICGRLCQHQPGGYFTQYSCKCFYNLTRGYFPQYSCKCFYNLTRRYFPQYSSKCFYNLTRGYFPQYSSKCFYNLTRGYFPQYSSKCFYNLTRGYFPQYSSKCFYNLTRGYFPQYSSKCFYNLTRGYFPQDNHECAAPTKVIFVHPISCDCTAFNWECTLLYSV